VIKEEENPTSTTTTVTNPTKSTNNNDQSSTSSDETNNNGSNVGSGGDDTKTTPAPPACVWHGYFGDELTPGVKAQIGQYATYDGKASYVSAVGYSEYSTNGQKYNIKYNFENGDNFISESSIQSVSGAPGYYSIAGDPIKISDRPSYCPAS
jgi:hypothetical protein